MDAALQLPSEVRNPDKDQQFAGVQPDHLLVNCSGCRRKLFGMGNATGGGRGFPPPVAKYVRDGERVKPMCGECVKRPVGGT